MSKLFDVSQISEQNKTGGQTAIDAGRRSHQQIRSEVWILRLHASAWDRRSYFIVGKISFCAAKEERSIFILYVTNQRPQGKLLSSFIVNTYSSWAHTEFKQKFKFKLLILQTEVYFSFCLLNYNFAFCVLRRSFVSILCNLYVSNLHIWMLNNALVLSVRLLPNIYEVYEWAPPDLEVASTNITIAVMWDHYAVTWITLHATCISLIVLCVVGNEKSLF